MNSYAISALDLLPLTVDDVASGWRQPCPAKNWIRESELLSIDRVLQSDESTMPGETLTQEVFEHDQERRRVLALVRKLATDGVSWGADVENKVDVDTAAAATAFFRRLDGNYRLPKIAPNDDGGLLLIWEGASAPSALAIQSWKLHFVAGIGTAKPYYADDIAFDGEHIPENILRRIPLG